MAQLLNYIIYGDSKAGSLQQASMGYYVLSGKLPLSHRTLSFRMFSKKIWKDFL